jgi:aminoglycoside phosphotransferase (APT) family kinase protein
MVPDCVAACMSALGDTAFTWEGEIARRINSRVHRVRRGGTLMAVKECFDPHSGAPLAAAEREYAALQRVRACTADGVPQLVAEPLVLVRASGAYAMSWLPGRPATELVLEAGGARRAERVGALCGAWLRDFHALGAQPARRGDFESREPLLRRIAEASTRHDPLTRRAALALIESAKGAAADELPASWTHGDMKSDNVLVDDERVSGLDVQLVDTNSVAYDLAPFLNHLRLLRWSARGLVHRRALDTFAAAFLRAYSDHADQWSLPILWVRAYLLVELPWAPPRNVRARIARWPARAELARVLDALERA